MSITLNHFVNKKNKFILSASAEIEYDENKIYKLGLQVTDCRTKNPLSYNNTLLTEGEGIVEICVGNAYLYNGITINVTADITEVPPSPEPQAEPVPHPETESDREGKIIETAGEKYDLFGLHNCLNHIDFQQSLSYSWNIDTLTCRSLKACADISLKTDYCLDSIVKSSVHLTYISTASKSIRPKWDIDIINNQITFQSDLPDRASGCDFSGFRLKAIALIRHKPSGLILPFPLNLDNR